MCYIRRRIFPCCNSENWYSAPVPTQCDGEPRCDSTHCILLETRAPVLRTGRCWRCILGDARRGVKTGVSDAVLREAQRLADANGWGGGGQQKRKRSEGGDGGRGKGKEQEGGGRGKRRRVEHEEVRVESREVGNWRKRPTMEQEDINVEPRPKRVKRHVHFEDSGNASVGSFSAAVPYTPPLTLPSPLAGPSSSMARPQRPASQPQYRAYSSPLSPQSPQEGPSSSMGRPQYPAPQPQYPAYTPPLTPQSPQEDPSFWMGTPQHPSPQPQYPASQPQYRASPPQHRGQVQPVQARTRPSDDTLRYSPEVSEPGSDFNTLQQDNSLLYLEQPYHEYDPNVPPNGTEDPLENFDFDAYFADDKNAGPPYDSEQHPAANLEDQLWADEFDNWAAFDEMVEDDAKLEQLKQNQLQSPKESLVLLNVESMEQESAPNRLNYPQLTAQHDLDQSGTVNQYILPRQIPQNYTNSFDSSEFTNQWHDMTIAEGVQDTSPVPDFVDSSINPVEEQGRVVDQHRRVATDPASIPLGDPMLFQSDLGNSAGLGNLTASEHYQMTDEQLNAKIDAIFSGPDES